MWPKKAPKTVRVLLNAWLQIQRSFCNLVHWKNETRCSKTAAYRIYYLQNRLLEITTLNRICQTLSPMYLKKPTLWHFSRPSLLFHRSKKEDLPKKGRGQLAKHSGRPMIHSKTILPKLVEN